MTSVAYRAGIMAADMRISAGDYIKPESVRKIHRLPNGSLFAAAGDSGAWLMLLRWLREPVGERPAIADAEAIVVAHDGTIEYFTGSGKREVGAPFVVLGSGLPVLLGALHAGA